MGRTFWLLTTLTAALLVACGAAFAQAQPPQNAGLESATGELCSLLAEGERL
jgi:hypothetical protein